MLKVILIRKNLSSALFMKMQSNILIFFKYKIG